MSLDWVHFQVCVCVCVSLCVSVCVSVSISVCDCVSVCLHWYELMCFASSPLLLIPICTNPPCFCGGSAALVAEGDRPGASLSPWQQQRPCWTQWSTEMQQQAVKRNVFRTNCYEAHKCTHMQHSHTQRTRKHERTSTRRLKRAFMAKTFSLL